ncbi:hypothetical protein SprV_0100085200 [Sparganum proliferum]
MASGIASAGNGVGYCVIPLLLDTLAKSLDWRMALLLYSIACTAIFCLAALTMKPLRVLPILTEEPFSASIAHNSQTVGTSLAEPSRGHTHLETVKEEEDDDDAETDADSSTDHPASWSGELTLQTEDPANIPRNSDSMPSAKRQRKRGFSMPAMSSAQLNSLMNSLISVRRSKSGGRGVNCIKVTHTSQKRGVSGIGGRRISLFHPKRDSIGTEASFGAHPRLSSLFRRKLSVQAERSLVNESLFRLTPRPSRQANPATNPGHMHDFRESSLHLGNGTYIGRPMALSPLSRADSFYSASLASLRYQDRRLREAAARSSMVTETEMDVSFKSCLSFDLSASLQMSRRTTNASTTQNRRQQLRENSTAAAAAATVADELAQSMLTIEGNAEPQKLIPPMFASRCRRLGSFLDAHFDLSLLRSVDFWLVTSILITSQLAYFMPFVYLVEYAKECGISPREGVLLIMIIGIANTVGRCFCGILGNVPRLDVIVVSLTGCCMTACCQFLLTILPRRFADLGFYAAAYGFFASYLTLIPIVIVNVLGLEKLTSSYGNASFFRGIAAAIGPVLAGFITTDNDCSPVFYFCGVCFAVCCCLHLGFYRTTLLKRLRNFFS